MKNRLLTFRAETSLCRKLKLRVTFLIYMKEPRVVYRVSSDTLPLSVHIPAHPFVIALCAAVRPYAGALASHRMEALVSAGILSFTVASSRPARGPAMARTGPGTGPGRGPV